MNYLIDLIIDNPILSLATIAFILLFVFGLHYQKVIRKYIIVIAISDIQTRLRNRHKKIKQVDLQKTRIAIFYLGNSFFSISRFKQ